MSRHNVDLGKWGEQLAESTLVQAGATILARNFRSDPGEIDLVIEHDGDIVAVEVKTRTDFDLEAPEEAVTWWKLRRMSHGLATYAMTNDLMERHWRLDVVAIQLDLNGDVLRCEHIRDAYLG
ncbi:MAG TPA: YraN family protein [Chloroflexota bacterium]|nr:YraN family protein [Chloroflexota bacterium]